MTSQVALTTLFTPPASCLTSFFRDDELATTSDAFGPSPTATECLPSGWQTSSNFYFSPGKCPSGYYTATTTVNQIGTVTETAAFCCPTKLEIFTRTLDSILTTFCVSFYDAGITRRVVIWSRSSVVSTQTTTGTGFAGATAIQVRFQATDNLTPATTVTVTATAPPSGSAEGLNTAAKVGLGVGIPIAVLLIMGIVVGMLVLRAKRSASRNEPVASQRYSEKDGRDDNERAIHGEYSNHPRELSGAPKRGELES